MQNMYYQSCLQIKNLCPEKLKELLKTLVTGARYRIYEVQKLHPLCYNSEVYCGKLRVNFKIDCILDFMASDSVKELCCFFKKRFL